MDITFEPMSDEHRIEIIDIFNFYILNSYSAYPEEKVSYDYYDKFLGITDNYPAFAIKLNDKIIGFCYLSSYNPLSSFKETAVITYFIDKEHTGKGIGKIALNKLETEARRKGIKNILANIASINEESIAFHSKNGFKKCGEFQGIIQKNNRQFDIIWMQKKLD
jgi:L-amino acid N-acyltransferase YncA